jgi:hypothetical protein
MEEIVTLAAEYGIEVPLLSEGRSGEGKETQG